MIKEVLKKLDILLQLMLEEREERKAVKETTAAKKRDRELVKEAKEHLKTEPLPIISTVMDTKHVKQSDGDLIPFGLSEKDKEILNDFYRKS
jgi:hypothetical protein